MLRAAPSVMAAEPGPRVLLTVITAKPFGDPRAGFWGYLAGAPRTVSKAVVGGPGLIPY